MPSYVSGFLAQLAQAHLPGRQEHFSVVAPQLHLVLSVPGTRSMPASIGVSMPLLASASGFFPQPAQEHLPGGQGHFSVAARQSHLVLSVLGMCTMPASCCFFRLAR